jgi:opacity protein-like surface antigen
MPLRFAAAIALAALALPLAARAETYVRAGVAYEHSSETGFRDVDCSGTAPPALFGCAAGADGGLLSAQGGFGSTAAVEVGLGRRITPHLRLEGLVTYRPDLDFSGRANFVRTPGEQRVGADMNSLSALAVAYADLGVYGRLRPFLGLGAGVSSNKVGAVTFSFPGLGPTASTVTPNGRQTNFAWMAAAGVSLPVSSRLTLDVAYRYVDLGDVRTDAGPAVITRTSGVRSIDIAPTYADLVTQGVSASVRLSF